MSVALAASMTEAVLQATLIQAARALGFLVFHNQDSRRNEPGYPDLCLCGHNMLIFWELKTEHGRLRPASVTAKGRYLPSQADWLDALGRAETIDARVIRPRDLDEALELLRRAYEADNLGMAARLGTSHVASRRAKACR